jgi:hypothetical protein
VWVGLAAAAAAAVVGCGELGTELLPEEAASSASASGAGGASSSGSGEGGAGGDASGGAGGEGGAGGTACVPVVDPCGDATCGDVSDGCEMVSCGGCAAPKMCHMGACCELKTSCEKVCGPQDDGCGGTLACDDVCGAGAPMTCAGGACACADASDSPFGKNLCTDQGKKPYYCGASPTPDTPEGCVMTGLAFPMQLWCCP